MGIGKVFVNNKPESNTLGGILPLAKGGTGSPDSDGAANQLLALDLDRRNIANGVVGLNEQGKIYNELFTEETWDAAVSINGPTSIIVNSNNIYTIGRYGSFNEYNVSVSAGSVNRINDTIAFIAPSSPQTVIMALNGKSFNIDVVPVTAYITTPSITSPSTGSINLGPDVTFTSSSFGVSGGSDAHEGSDWQIATDSNFTSILSSITNNSTNKTSWAITGLLANTTYYVRTRYKGTNIGYSNWSVVVSFTTKISYIANTEQAKLLASDGGASDAFGASSAISGDGNYAIVGAYYNGQNSAYVYKRTGTNWTQEAKLTSGFIGAGTEAFGHSVSISGDGSYAIVGAYGWNSNKGCAVIFSRSGTLWTEQPMLLANDGIDGDYFGISVCMSDDGLYAIIGATGDDSSKGSVYIFTRSGTTWSQQAKIVAADGIANDQFGVSLDINGIGTYCIIGAWFADLPSKANAGAAYIFTRSGTTWSQQTKLNANDSESEGRFGKSVAISDDGSYAVVGAPQTSANRGSAYIFIRSGSTWTKEAKLLNRDGSGTNDLFGEESSMNNNGSVVVISARAHAGNRGAAYIFTRSGTTWTQQSKLMASDGTSGDHFAKSLDINNDAKYIIAGAMYDTIGIVNTQGSAYIFA